MKKSFFIALAITLTIGAVMFLIPTYSVWSARKAGEAVLAHAESAKEVAVTDARAKMEAAALLSQADTIRAHGIARANQIIGNSLTEKYLKWYWIDNIDNANSVIYIPTEANVPIMEANRLKVAEKDSLQ